MQNVKEHATLSAGANVEHGVEVELKEKHVNRAADRGCCVSTHKLAFSQPIGYNNRSEMELQTAA